MDKLSIELSKLVGIKPVCFETPENFITLLEIMFLFKFDFKELDTYVESVLNAALEEVKAGNMEFIKLLQEQDWGY